MSLAASKFFAAPDLPLKIAVASEVLEREAENRERFRDECELNPDAEFINGQIVIFPAFHELHIRVSLRIGQIFSLWTSIHNNGSVILGNALCGFSRNDYEPDIAWFGPEKTAALASDTTIYPIPDFIIEIVSPFSEKRNRGVKLEDYAAHGVPEYWIVDADKRTIEQYLLSEDGDEYRLAEKLGHGDIKPFSFPGLAIPLVALFEDAANLSFLRLIL